MAVFSSRSIGVLVLVACAFFLSLAKAATPASSTFVEQDSTGENYTISLNIPENNDNDDLFFSLSAPAGQGWIAFGFGSQMQGALIFLAYPDEGGNNVTLSPRLGKGHVMPLYYSNVTTEVLSGSGINNDTFVVNAKCTNCRSWDGGAIDLTSVAQPMIYAVGSSSDSVKSNSETATIEQHYAQGTFSLDMKAATGVGGVPTINNSNSGNDTVVRDGGDGRPISSPIHAILMGGSFVLGYPLGVLVLRSFHKVWLHWMVQTFTTFIVVLGAAAGIYISIKYDKNPHLNSPHQGIGLAITFMVLVQVTLGFLHHRLYLKTRAPTFMGKIHRFLGPTAILLGLINVAIGFNFAGRADYSIAYAIIVLLLIIIIGTILFFKKRRQRRKEAMTSTAAQNFRQPDVPLNAYGQPQGWYGNHQ